MIDRERSTYRGALQYAARFLCDDCSTGRAEPEQMRRAASQIRSLLKLWSQPGDDVVRVGRSDAQPGTAGPDGDGAPAVPFGDDAA